MKKEKINVNLFEAFAGIGSQYKALKNISKKMNWEINQVGIIEWYIDAIIGYQLIHYGKPKNLQLDSWENISLSLDSKKILPNKSYNDKFKKKYEKYIASSLKKSNNKFDIKKINYNDIPKNIDIFTYSFPCQDLSIQGKQKGMEKNSGTKSGLLWELERIFSEMKINFKNKEMPKYLLLENVKNIISKNHKQSFNLWLDFLNRMGYESKFYILNAKNFGVPQNRERFFCISVRNDYKKKVKFNFPNEISNNYNNDNLKLSDIFDDEIDNALYLNNLNKYNISNEIKTKSNIIRSQILNYTNFNSESYVYSPKGIGCTLTASGANSRIKIRESNGRIRKLSVKECYKYMGFDEKDYKVIKDEKILSDQKMIYIAGNSIVVPLLESLFSIFKFE